jgi:hypothetical protein
MKLLLVAFLSLLLPVGQAYGQGVFPDEMTGYIISTLNPSEKIYGKARLQQDGSFSYTGNNGVTVSGQIDLNNPTKVTGTGATQLPRILFLQLKYADGTSSAKLSFKGALGDGVFKGTFSSVYEQGLYFFATPGNEKALQATAEFTLPVPGDLNYSKALLPGPALIVLPGNFTADPEFADEVSAITTSGTTEQELQRAGFGVIESGRLSSAMPTLLKAYSSGNIDPETSDLMNIGALATTKWVVFLDIESAKKLNKAPPPQTRPSQPLSPNSNYGKFAAIVSVLGELGDKRVVDLWGIRAKYRILDRRTATLLHEGVVEDVLMTAQVTSKDLVSVTKHQRDVSFFNMMRRVVQLAVEDISKRYK